jgi:NTP pyrophosphatase (non-canonical NTP hydrolase)
MDKNLNALARQIHQQTVISGFVTQHGLRPVDTHVALIHTEVSEIFEAHRDGQLPNCALYEHQSAHGPYLNSSPENEEFQPGKPVGIDSEVADVIIRALDFCGEYGIDIERAIVEKMHYNKTRPLRHGGRQA